MEERVHFSGTVEHREVPDCVQAADVFVRAARSEGLGNSFLEAMAAGVVTVGTSVGGITDFLADGQTGFLTEPDNPTHLARSIERALALPPNERHLLIDRARTLVQRDYNWDTIASAMIEVFDFLCASS